MNTMVILAFVQGLALGALFVLIAWRAELRKKLAKLQARAGDRYEIAIEVEASQAEATVDRLSAKVNALVDKIEKITSATKEG